MNITGKLLKSLPLESGEGQNGEWKKQPILIETDGEYPKEICIDIWNGKIDLSQLKTGQTITVSVNVESRLHEASGRYFTNISAWKIETDEQPAKEKKVEPEPEQGDLPF